MLPHDLRFCLNRQLKNMRYSESLFISGFYYLQLTLGQQGTWKIDLYELSGASQVYFMLSLLLPGS